MPTRLLTLGAIVAFAAIASASEATPPSAAPSDSAETTSTEWILIDESRMIDLIKDQRNAGIPRSPFFEQAIDPATPDPFGSPEVSATFLPTPGSIVLLAFAGLATLTRRRKK